MEDRLKIEISEDVLEILRKLAQEQERPESELLEEALVAYIRESGYSDMVVKTAEETVHRSWIQVSTSPGPEASRFLALMDRMSSRFDLDADEATRIAVEEQKAFRAERAERERERAER